MTGRGRPFTPEQRDRGRALVNAAAAAAADQRAERVAQLTRAGSSTLAIAVRLGVSERTVTRLRRRAGVSECGAAVPHPPEVWELVERLLADGASRAEAARTAGISYSVVRARFPDAAWTREQVWDYARQVKLLNQS